MNWIDLTPYKEKCETYVEKLQFSKPGYFASPENTIQARLAGKLGECIFWNLADCEPNFEIYDGGDGGADFIWNGLRIDVKTTQYWRQPELKLSKKEINKSDIIILAAVDFDNYKGRLVGSCSNIRLINSRYRPYRNKGNRYWLTEAELNSDLSMFKK